MHVVSIRIDRKQVEVNIANKMLIINTYQVLQFGIYEYLNEKKNKTEKKDEEKRVNVVLTLNIQHISRDKQLHVRMPTKNEK